MLQGRCKWWNDVKGFGFITPADASASGDVFVHYSAIDNGAEKGRKSLSNGEAVEYEAAPGKKGLAATRVVRCVPHESVNAPERYASTTK